MLFDENRFISITETKQKQKEFINKINKEDEILVLSNNKPCYVALSWDRYKKLSEELEYYKEKELIEARLKDIDDIDISSLKSHDELKKEGLF